MSPQDQNRGSREPLPRESGLDPGSQTEPTNPRVRQRRLSAEGAATGVDPITFSVLLGRFDAIVKEMTRVLEMSAWSSIIALAHDYSCSLYDAAPRQISMFDALPIHTTSLHLVVEAISSAFEGDISDGDVYLCNDPYSGNTHVGDYTTAAPVFVHDDLVFWSVARGHQVDTGSHLRHGTSVSALNVYQEGVTIPPTRLVANGTVRPDVLGLLRANLRFPDMVEGDLRAQIGAISKGRERLIELCDEYGLEVVLDYVEEIIAYTSRRAASAFAAIPDGVYRGTAWLDTDGFDLEHLQISTEIVVNGDRVSVDFTGSAPQTKGGTNGSLATLQAAGAVPFLYYIDADIPHNHGILEHLEVSGEEGSICWARYPGSTSTATVMPSDAMQAAINRAMVAVLPDRVPAGGTRFSSVPQVSGRPRDGMIPWRFSFINNAGGGPASKGADGWPLWVTEGALGAMKVHPVEQLELLYPVLIERLEIETDSCGFGEWIGGTGVRTVVRPLEDDLVVITFGDGMFNPPHGAMGGEPGIGGGQYVEDAATETRRFYSTCAEFMVHHPDEFYVGVSTGGGAWGPPYARDVERVRADVRNGIVSHDAAKRVFGVVLSKDPDPAVDLRATEALRAQLSQLDVAIVTPIVPNASTWLTTMMRDGDRFIFNPRL